MASSAASVKTSDSEFTQWRWLPMQELPSRVAPFKRAVYTEVVREFAHLQGWRAEGHFPSDSPGHA